MDECHCSGLRPKSRITDEGEFWRIPLLRFKRLGLNERVDEFVDGELFAWADADDYMLSPLRVCNSFCELLARYFRPNAGWATMACMAARRE